MGHLFQMFRGFSRNFTVIKFITFFKDKIANYFQQVISFLRSPCTYFFYESIFFICFLLFYSYNLLCEMVFIEEKFDSNNMESSSDILEPKNVSKIECLLAVWVWLIFLEEIFQVSN